MTADFFKNNRRKLFDKMEEGAVVFLHSGIAPVKSHDAQMAPFVVNRNFYYLTGIESQNVWLVLGKTAMGCTEALFIEQPDEEIIKWNGKMLTKTRAFERSGIAENDVKYMQEIGRPYPHCGYGGHFYQWIYSENPQPYNSWGNGSAMRVSSAAWLYNNIDSVRHAAKLTAEVTHNHPEGIKGAEATASAIFLARTGKTKADKRMSNEIAKHKNFLNIFSLLLK